jgi:hypothetical protein
MKRPEELGDEDDAILLPDPDPISAKSPQKKGNALLAFRLKTRADERARVSAIRLKLRSTGKRIKVRASVLFALFRGALAQAVLLQALAFA